MGLFKKKQLPIYQYRVYMNASGKRKDEAEEIVIIEDISEFLAVRAAEKKFRQLKVYWIEKVGEEDLAKLAAGIK